jgi:hypothetical protein
MQFDYGMNVVYDNLLKVFEYSVRKHMPDVKFVVYKEKEPQITHTKKAFTSNNYKLEKWLQAFGTEADDDEIIFMDCDMLVLQDLATAFKEMFDIGYTRRTAAKMPYNGGVVFARNTPEAKLFVQLWQYIDGIMYRNETFHVPYRNKYAGMNQAAFGFMKEFIDFNLANKPEVFRNHVVRTCGGPVQPSPRHHKQFEHFKQIEKTLKHMDGHRNELVKVKLHEFLCAEYNACKEDMTRIGPHTKVIHIKSDVRRQCIEYMTMVKRLGGKPVVNVELLAKYNIKRTRALELWSKYYHEAQEKKTQ